MKSNLFILLPLWLVAINAYSQIDKPSVKAVDGDGIYSILRNNGISPSLEHIDDFIRLNEGKIGKNRALFKGKTYLLPVYEKTIPIIEKNSLIKEGVIVADSLQNLDTIQIETTVKPIIEIKTDSALVELVEKEFENIPIFGPEHEEVEIVSDELKGAHYYLISGHGGPDPGALGKYNNIQLAEDEYAYDVTLRLARRLISMGATVYLIIRDNNDGIRGGKILPIDRDEVAYPDKVIPRSQKARLRQRVKIVNDLYKEHLGVFKRLVVTHVDSRSQGKNIDVFFYHSRKSKMGKSMALQLQETFKQKYEEFQPGRTYHGSVTSHREIYVIEKTLPPAVFIELGNIKNSIDQKRFLLKSNREALANWISEGLLIEYRKDNK